jgi:hypothetical protein
MTKTILQATFVTELLTILEETFETHHGVYLDKGTSLLTTLDQISADEASLPIGNQCATIAAQVEHVIFYLEILQQYMSGQEIVNIDWNEIWNRVSRVTNSEWAESKAKLKASYDRLIDMLQNLENWEHNDTIGGSMAIMVHTAYHLGEIRQALCTVGNSVK